MIRRILLTVSVIALMGARAAHAQTGLPVGTVAPNASVETVDGKPVQLARYIVKGKPTLIQFWATWCGNCKALEPQMSAAAKKYAGKVTLVGVAVGLSSGSLARLPRAGAWMLWVKRVFAIVMIGVAEYYLIQAGQLWL